MRHMCILESTAHLSFHAHSIHTPMTGIPELPPQKDGTKVIGDCAFSISKSLTAITTPNGVTSIGNPAFYDCFRL